MSVSRKRKGAAQPDELVDNPRKHIKTIHSSTALGRAPGGVKMQRQVSTSATDATFAQKRKRGSEDETIQTCSKTKVARTRGLPSARHMMTPQSKRFYNALPPSPAETPSKRTARLFDGLDLSEHKLVAAYDTPPASPEGSQADFEDILPPQLADLVGLFAAFLSAINEQTALSRSDFRIDLHELLKITTRVWNKRAVGTDDIRRILAVMKEKDLNWTIVDYGRAGLCLIRSQTTTGDETIGILDTIKLKRGFQNELQRRWARWQESHKQESTVSAFIEQLPVVAITKSDAVDKAASLSSRGKERLSSLRRSQAVAQTVEAETKSICTKQGTVQTRGTNLLDRILAKQAVSASMPAGPTKDQLERRSSLQRIEEIARVLEVLAAGRARASFSMQSVVQQLQQSLRSPISRIEVQRCVSIMAVEIMPQFVSTISSGSVNGIVITRAGKLGLADLKQRLADVDI